MNTRHLARLLPTALLAVAFVACADGSSTVVDEGDPTMTPEDMAPISTEKLDEGTVDEPDPDADKVSENEGRVAEGTLSGLWVYDHVQAFANAACRYVSACSNGTYVGHQPTASRATDLMVSAYGTSTTAGKAKGDKVVTFAVNNRRKFGIMYVIWRQRINTFDGRGWRQMENRGSITQNHFDHVHISYYTTANMGLATNTSGLTTVSTCNSYTLGRTVTKGTCVQSKQDYLWYQCGSGGAWLYAPNVRTGGAGPVGTCTAKYAR